MAVIAEHEVVVCRWGGQSLLTFLPPLLPLPPSACESRAPAPGNSPALPPAEAVKGSPPVVVLAAAAEEGVVTPAPPLGLALTTLALSTNPLLGSALTPVEYSSSS